MSLIQPNFSDFQQNQKRLKESINKKDIFEESRQLMILQHGMTHLSQEAEPMSLTFADMLWDSMTEACFKAIYLTDHGSIARNIWHTTRIEDMTMNILVAKEDQVFLSQDFISKINCAITDTGNAMTNEELIIMTQSVNMDALKEYTIAVGNKTKAILSSLTFQDMKRKVEPSGLKKILDEKGVLNVEGAGWLIDFWGKKNVSGLILMPATRHNMVHINQSLRLKARWAKSHK